jgi:hypothetical protein
VVVDPTELDRAAANLREQGLDASGLVCRLRGAADGVDMPPDVQGRVRAAVDSAAANLDGLGRQISRLADFARLRAAATRRIDDPATLDAALSALLAGGKSLAKYRPYLKQLDQTLNYSGKILEIGQALAEASAELDKRTLRNSRDHAERSRAAQRLADARRLADKVGRINAPLRVTSEVAGITDDRAAGKSWPEIAGDRAPRIAGAALGAAAAPFVCSPVLAAPCAMGFSEVGAEVADRAVDGVEKVAERIKEGSNSLVTPRWR